MTIEDIEFWQMQLAHVKKLAKEGLEQQEPWMRISPRLSLNLVVFSELWLGELAHRAGYHHFLKGEK